MWAQIKSAQGETAEEVYLDNRMIKGLAALASDATRLARFAGEIKGGKLSGAASIALPAGLWINLSVTMSGEHSGLPPLYLQVGRVSLPSAAGRWLLGGARSILRFKGANIPPLDGMVQYLHISEQNVIARLSLPHESGIVDGVIATAGTNVNDEMVREVYCRLSDAQVSNPANDLSEVVRRTFNQTPSVASEEYIRAAFIALSFHVVGRQAEGLAPEAARLTKRCPRFYQDIQLHERSDLAKHWAFSAALAVVLGEQAATNLGEWKELNDSGAKGSGFSFVDIAADRAGLRTALHSLDPASAQRVIRKLGRATETDLLPPALLHAPESLPEVQFKKRFGGVGQERYRRAISFIDQELAQSGR